MCVCVCVVVVVVCACVPVSILVFFCVCICVHYVHLLKACMRACVCTPSGGLYPNGLGDGVMVPMQLVQVHSTRYVWPKWLDLWIVDFQELG